MIWLLLWKTVKEAFPKVIIYYIIPLKYTLQAEKRTFIAKGTVKWQISVHQRTRNEDNYVC
jgi:hypothetical protein